MDPEELYRLIEKQQEVVYHTKTSSYEDEDDQDPSDPGDIYQYLNSYQPIETTVEVSCSLDEAPDLPTLPTRSNTFIMLTSFLLVSLFIYFLFKVIGKVTKSSHYSGRTVACLIRQIKQVDYEVLIWTHPNFLLSRLTLLIELVEQATQRLFECDNERETVSLDSLHKQIEETQKIFKHLLYQDDCYASLDRARDSDEKLLILTNSGSLRLLRDRLLDRKKTVDEFISTRNSIIYELNNARSEENCEEMQICLSLCEKLDNKYLQRSPHLSWIQQPSNANGNDSIEFYGTFNFKSLDDYQEGKAFVEESNKKEIEERVKEIKEDIDRDLQVRQNLIQNLARYEPNLLLNSPESSIQQLLQISSMEENVTTSREEKVGSMSSNKKHQEETATTEREGKVGSSLSITTHSQHQQQLQQLQGGRTELATISLILMSSMGMNEEKIVIEGQRKLRKDIRDLEKEQKISKNAAYIKASERFREKEKLLQIGYKKDLSSQTIVAQRDQSWDETLQERRNSKRWRNVLMFVWFWFIGVLAAYLYCLGSVIAAQDHPTHASNFSSAMLTHPLASLKYWLILQLKSFCTLLQNECSPDSPVTSTVPPILTMASFLSATPVLVDYFLSFFSLKSYLRSLVFFSMKSLFSTLLPESVGIELLPVVAPCVVSLIEIPIVPILFSLFFLWLRWYRISSAIAYGGILFSLRKVIWNYLSSSVYLGSLLSIWGALYFLLETFDQRISWRTYTYGPFNHKKQFSIDWRWSIYTLLPLLLTTTAYMLGYCVTFSSD